MKFLLVLGFSVSLLFSLNHCAKRLVGGVDSNEAAQKRIIVAKAYIDEGDTRRALEHLQKAEEYESKSPELFHTYALLYRAEDDPDRQEYYYKKALGEDKSNAQIKNNYGSFLCTHGEAKKGLKYLEQASEDYKYSGRAESYVNRGMCELGFDEVEAAEKSFQQALRLNTNSVRPYLELADIYFNKNDMRLADLYYQQFVSKSASQTPRSLWLGIQIARKQINKNLESSLSLFLQNRYPNSSEYQEFLKTK
jgi:type IV pilus assembly protein PilF